MSLEITTEADSVLDFEIFEKTGLDIRIYIAADGEEFYAVLETPGGRMELDKKQFVLLFEITDAAKHYTEILKDVNLYD